MSTDPIKPATSFWVVGIVALIWNCLGVMAYLQTVMMSPQDLQAMPEQQRALMESTPTWSTGAFAIAVWGGTIGSILLVLRKKLATTVLILSLAGIVVQMFHALFYGELFRGLWTRRNDHANPGTCYWRIPDLVCKKGSHAGLDFLKES